MRKAIVLVLLLVGAVWAGPDTQPGADAPEARGPGLPPTVNRAYDIRNYLMEPVDYPLHPTAKLPTTRRGEDGVRDNLDPPITDSEESAGGLQRIDDLEKLITSTIAPDSWRDAGGSTGAVTALHGKLYVTQTPELQTPIAKLIESATAGISRTVSISATWLLLSHDEYSGLHDLASPAPGTVFARAHMLCTDGQIVHVISGAGPIGLQVQPMIASERNEVFLDVLNEVGGDRAGPIQRFHTTARVLLGKPAVIGGITFTPATAADPTRELYLVIEADALPPAGAAATGPATPLDLADPGSGGDAPKIDIRAYDLRDYLLMPGSYPLDAKKQRQTSGPVRGSAIDLPDFSLNSTSNNTAQDPAGTQPASAQPDDPERDRYFDLGKVIEGLVDPDSWRDAGGSIGSIRDLNGKIYVTQTVSGQAKVAKVIEQATADANRPLHISATWLHLTGDELSALREPAKAGSGDAIIRLDDPALQKAPAFARGELRCIDGQTVSIVGIGGRLALQTTATLSAGGDEATIDVQNVVGASAGAASAGQEFHTTARIPLGADVVIGGITLEPAGKDPPRQLYLVMRVDAE